MQSSNEAPQRDPARWKQLDALLDAVLELPADQRPAFLDQACDGDDSLRKEIDRLLAHEVDVGSFIETPAFQESSAQMDTSNLVSLLTGDSERVLREGRQVADRYQILSRIGKGGMGEVWRAFDLKLRIDVALKSLRLDLQRRPEELVDLIRHEVRTAREVISPNVCRIFDLVTENDQELISMEYIDGITLLDMMEQKGPLDLREARDIAAQFLAGLEAVHSAGLVHRDLKPENIMITRTGRVVVMDLGIAEQVAQTGSAISGTLPYMSPEQLAGEKIDARSDIFSAGVVLAEMIHTKGINSKNTREIIWKAVREDPMKLPESPWKAVITRAVAEKRENRFESAAALSRALEDITLRAEAEEARTPYPGLSSFQETDADYFFGREQEVETLIKKLQQQNLAALIGPSGAGKTSLLQAGLIPVLPKDWRCVITTPGDAPFSNLKQSLASVFPADERANADEFEEPEVVIRILRRLRQSHAEFVLIVDRFEELFTLNSTATQSRFAELLGHAAMEADIRILLSMRDDFLISCKEHPMLAPIFSDLTAMLPLSGAALRRALVQPALKCGYRFEDETLVDDILRDVEKERGVLPLLAFAASLLWEKRDRDKGLLTREAYKQIGGVQGALAQHAEIMMSQLGSDNEPIVREIFRNLITAQHTRIARDTDELLSVFSDKKTAEAVLKVLIDARLLTSFEAAYAETTKRRVEISHESLITNWPRLVKWQTQEAESAQLRDQLRQAASLWVERGRSPDLLWTGSAFLEFQLWRPRYPGGLTITEEAFARAMTQHANRKRRQRRITVVAMFVVLLITLGVIGNFWRKASTARDDALLQAKRAEAGVVLNVGRAIQDADPTTKLAHAIASLELADTPQARRFALQALSEAPTAHVMEIGGHVSIELSPDGKWIAEGRHDGAVDLLPRDASAIVNVQPPFKGGNYVPWSSQFSPDSNLLLWTWREHPEVVKVWSLSQRTVVRTFQMEGLTMCLVRGDKAFLITDARGRKGAPFGWADPIIRIWRFDQKEPEMLGRVNLPDNSWKNLDIDPRGHWISYITSRGVCVRSLDGSGIGPEKQIGSNETGINFVRFAPDGERIAFSNSTGIKIRSLLPGSKNPDQAFAGIVRRIWFDSKGSFLYGQRDSDIAEWDLSMDSAQPVIYRSPGGAPHTIVFDSENRWIATGAGTTLATYPSKYVHPYVLHSKGSASNSRFTPDGKSLVTGSAMDGIRVWNLPGGFASQSRTLWNHKIFNAFAIDVDPSGQHVLAATSGGGVHLISMNDSKDAVLEGSAPNEYDSAVFSTDGKLAAAAGVTGIQIWDLQSGESRILEKSKGITFYRLQYSPDGSLISGDVAGKLYRWNLSNDSPKIWAQAKESVLSDIATSNDGRFLAVVTSATSNVSGAKQSISKLVLYDLQSGKSSLITSHGNHVRCVAFDPGGTRLVTGDTDGIVRVGPVTGEAPHLLLGHSNAVESITVHPGGQWIASTEWDSVVRVWQMPQGKPLETLPYNEFLSHLRAETNVRVVTDKDSPSGYSIQYPPFSGWKEMANW